MFEFNFDKLQENLPKGTLQEKKNWGPDERFWKLGRNKQDKGTAIIRLLVDQDGLMFVKLFSHSIKKFDPSLGKDRYYIEDSPQSIGQPCPASEAWQELMKIGTTEAKEKAKILNRKVKFITNILVVKDPANPQNEGKVFLWEFGTKLNEKFINAMQPSDEDLALGTKAKQLFDPFNGSSVMLKIKKASGFFNYDDTEIMDASEICKEEEWPELQAKTYKLQEFLSPEHYGNYDELKIKLDKVLLGSASSHIGSVTDQSKAPFEEENLIEETDKVQNTPKVEDTKKTEDSDDDLDDLLSELENS